MFGEVRLTGYECNGPDQNWIIRILDNPVQLSLYGFPYTRISGWTLSGYPERAQTRPWRKGTTYNRMSCQTVNKYGNKESLCIGHFSNLHINKYITNLQKVQQ